VETVFATAENVCAIWNGLGLIAVSAASARTTVVVMECAIMETAFAILDTMEPAAIFIPVVCLVAEPQIVMIMACVPMANVSASQVGKVTHAIRILRRLQFRNVLCAMV